MKKVLLFFAMVFAACTAFAETKDVTFDISETKGISYTAEDGSPVAGHQVVTLDGVTIESDIDAIWSSQYRFYKNSVNTFSTAKGEIVKIEFTCTAAGTANYGPGNFTAEDGEYTYENKVGTWTGSAASVTLTAATNQVRATKIVVTVDFGDDPFANKLIKSITKSDFVEAGKWYLLKQKRGTETPVHDEGVGATMKRAAKDDVVVAGSVVTEVLDYLVQFIPTENDGAYNIQFANGNYWASSMTTTADEPGEYNVYMINGEAGHIGINKYDMANIVDNNGNGNTLAFWASGEVKELNGNNDWTVWEVELIAKSKEADDLKALVAEAEAEYAKNNVNEVGENLITDPSWFSSPFTETQEGDITKLLDGDCSTFWHSSWSATDGAAVVGEDGTSVHVHYLQVDLPETVTGDLQVTLGRRNNGGSFCANDNVVLLGVEASADGENFESVGQIDMPLVSGEWYAGGVVSVENAKVFRFYNDQSNGTEKGQRGYWHCGEFQLNLVTNYCANVLDAEAAAALLEAVATAKAVGATATQDDIDALQTAIDAYKAAVEDVVTDINTVAAPVVASKNVYDLTGRRVVAPVKGQLYIQNGKKMIF